MLRIKELLPTTASQVINQAHKEEVEIITKLHTAAKENDKQLSFELLHELILHTKKYFSNEEKMMKEAKFPEFHTHKFEHDKQILDLESILSFYEMTNDTKSLYNYLEDSLTTWIVEHVEDIDIPTAAFIENK